MRESVFRAIADPHRRTILRLLKAGSMTAGEIAQAFAITKGSLSYHFNILARAGLIRRERRGKEVIYSLNISVLEELASALLDMLDDPVRHTRGTRV